MSSRILEDLMVRYTDKVGPSSSHSGVTRVCHEEMTGKVLAVEIDFQHQT